MGKIFIGEKRYSKIPPYQKNTTNWEVLEYSLALEESRQKQHQFTSSTSSCKLLNIERLKKDSFMFFGIGR